MVWPFPTPWRAWLEAFGLGRFSAFAGVRDRCGPAARLGGAPRGGPLRRALLPLRGGGRLAAARPALGWSSRSVPRRRRRASRAPARAPTCSTRGALPRRPGDVHPQVVRAVGVAALPLRRLPRGGGPRPRAERRSQGRGCPACAPLFSGARAAAPGSPATDQDAERRPPRHDRQPRRGRALRLHDGERRPRPAAGRSTVVGGNPSACPPPSSPGVRWLPGATAAESLRSLARVGRQDICHAHMTIAEAIAVRPAAASSADRQYAALCRADEAQPRRAYWRRRGSRHG